MLEKLKHAGMFAMGFAVLVGILALVVAFIRGSVWASTHLLSPLIAVGWFAVAVDVFVLLPLSVSTYLFGLIAWLLGFLLTYALWGAVAVVIGMLFMGLGVVPIGMVASAWNGLWEPFFTLLVLILVTWGARAGGFFIVASRGRAESQPMVEKNWT